MSEESHSEIASSLPLLAMTEKGAPLNDKRGMSSVFCSCLIHQAQLPNKLGNYIFKLFLAMTERGVPRNDIRNTKQYEKAVSGQSVAES